MTRAGRLCSLAVALAALPTASALAAGTVAQLPDPSIPVAAMPPYQAGFVVGENRFTGHVANSELVDVGVDDTGAVESVYVTQRLAIDGLGDVDLNIPAPVSSASALRSSQSTPGVRQFSVVWQGFSAGKKLLAARMRLRLREISPLLPLRVAVETERTGGRYRVGLVASHFAHATLHVFGGRGRAGEVARKLDTVLAALRRGRNPPSAIVSVQGNLKPETLRIGGSFDVEGELTVPGRIRSARVSGARVVGRNPLRLRFAASVGPQTRPLKVLVEGDGTAIGPAKLRLVARPAPLAVPLEPPGASTWTDALERGLVPRDGHDMLRLAIRRLSEVAFTRQYDSFLLSPDVTGTTRTTYVFRTAPPVKAAAAPAPVDHGSDTGLRAAGIALVVLAAGALVVWWAHA